MAIGKEYVMSEEMFVSHPAKDIFPLLCPVREYDWIPTWDCTLVHTKSGVVERGCVFVTDFAGEKGGADIWLTIEHEPPHRVSFVRTNAVRLMRYDIELTPVDGGTKLVWTQRHYPLPHAKIDKPDAAGYAALMKNLHHMLQHYLDTGEVLRA